MNLIIKDLSLSIHLNSILRNNSIIQHLPKNSPQRGNFISRNFTNTIWNKIFSSQDTVNNININDTNTFGTGIQPCECANSTYLIRNYGQIITGNLKLLQILILGR